MATPVKIKRIRNLGKADRVCDIEVQDNHNLFVCDKISKKPVLAHNCALVEKELGIEIAGWILVYVSRDAPVFSFKAEADYISEKEKRQQLELIDKYDRHYGYMREGLTRDTLQTLVDEKPCTSYEQYEKTYMGLNPCELAPVCFSKGALSSKLQTILEHQ